MEFNKVTTQGPVVVTIPQWCGVKRKKLNVSWLNMEKPIFYPHV